MTISASNISSGRRVGQSLPFGSTHVENLTPIFQYDAIYGVNAEQITPSTLLSGTATATDSSFTVTTGVTQNGRGTLATKKRLRYRPGQGFVGRFTALYSAGTSGSFQIAGFGHSEDGLFFGRLGALYGNQFGIYYSRRGVQETRTLTVTTGATAAGNVTITLNGTAFTVAVTNASDIYRTAWEIGNATYAGWVAHTVGATVVFQRAGAGVANGTYSFAAGATGAAASIAQTKAGVAITTDFITQSSWNVDKLDGTGVSGITLDPSKFNVFQINMQYLGAGAIQFYIETSPVGKTPKWSLVHTMYLPNTLTASSFGNPSFPFTISATQTDSSATDVSVKCASFAGFIEGIKTLTGNRYSYYAQSTAVDAANYRALFSIFNTRYFKGRANHATINLLSISAALKHTSPCIIYIIRGGVLSGNPNFTQQDADSCALIDTAATTVAVSGDARIIWSGHMGDTGNIINTFGGNVDGSLEIMLQPGEYFTIAARSTFGTPAWVTASINTREDQ